MLSLEHVMCIRHPEMHEDSGGLLICRVGEGACSLHTENPFSPDITRAVMFAPNRMTWEVERDMGPT